MNKTLYIQFIKFLLLRLLVYAVIKKIKEQFKKEKNKTEMIVVKNSLFRKS